MNVFIMMLRHATNVERLSNLEHGLPSSTGAQIGDEKSTQIAKLNVRLDFLDIAIEPTDSVSRFNLFYVPSSIRYRLVQHLIYWL